MSAPGVAGADDQDVALRQLRGLRYSLECIWVIRGSSSSAKSGTCGSWNGPVAITTLSASKRARRPR